MPLNRQNHTWIKPYRLEPDTPVEDVISRPYQSTWYVLRDLREGDEVVVTLTRCGVDYTLLGFVDIRAKALQLLAQAGAALGQPPAAQRPLLAGTVDAEDMDSDDMDSDDMDSEDMDSEDMDSDDMDSEDMDSDDMDSEDMDSDDLDTEDMDSDGRPDVEQFADVYGAAQRRALRAASVTPGVADETVTMAVRVGGGDLYFRVRGHDGAFAPVRPFRVTARVTRTDACAGVPLNPVSVAVPDVGKATALILTHTGRKSLGLRRESLRTGFRASLDTLATAMNGYVVDLSEERYGPGIHAAYEAWTSTPRCVPAAMAIVNAIREMIRELATRWPLEYIVIAGADDVIPFARIHDQAEISRESQWAGPYRARSALDAALAQDFFLSDDPYGAPERIVRLGKELYVPTIAVGRLVERASEIERYIEWFTTEGRVDLERALVTGYDFVEDLANEVRDTLRTASVHVDDIIGSSWSADDLRAKLFGAGGPEREDARYDLVAAQGHYSASTLVPANDGPRFRSSELDAVTNTSFAGTIWATIGCHSGHHILDAEARPYVDRLSFVEPLLVRGATVVAGTGYQYGETVLLANSERLYALFAEELAYTEDLDGQGYGGGVPLGRALVNAKARYLDGLLRVRGIDEKALGVATLYGVPAVRVHVPEPRDRPRRDYVAPEPTLSEGIASARLELAATDPEPRIATPLRPALPAVFRDVTARDAVATGVLWLGGTFAERPHEPEIAQPATESRPPKPRYRNRAFLPARPLRIARTQRGRDTLVFTPMQFSSEAGVVREWKSAVFDVRYSRRADQRILEDAPALRNARVIARDRGAAVAVDVVHHGAADEPVEAYASYLEDGALRTIALAAAHRSRGDGLAWVRRFRGTVDADPSRLRVFFQAAAGNGRVASVTNGGRLFGVEERVTPAPSTLSLEAPGAAGYRDQIEATATLRGAGAAPLAGREVVFRMGRSRLWTRTASDGIAKATLTVAVRPRAQAQLLVASFPGTAADAPSASSARVRVRKAATRFEVYAKALSPDAREIVARLVHVSRARPLGGRAVVVSSQRRNALVYTDPDGFVRLEPIDLGLGEGTHGLTLRFAGDARYSPCVLIAEADVRA